MPQERGYERQIGTGGAVGMPRASAAAFGAGIGAGMVDIADSLHRADMNARAIERQQTADSEAAGFNATFAKLREEADGAAVDARNNAQPGGAGHAEAMRAWWEKRAAGLTDGITDERVRRSANTQLLEFGGRLGASEYQWQEGRRVGKIVTDQGDMRATAANRAFRLADPKAFAEEMSLGRQGIEALQGVPEDVRDGLLRDYEQAVSVSFFNGMIERDPASVTRVLGTGAFDDILQPEQMERLRNGADIQVRRNDGAARAEAAQKLAATKEALATRRAELDAGAGKPQDWLDLGAQYEAIGDTSSAVTARAKGTGMAAAIGFRGEDLPQLDTRIAALTAKKHAGGLSTAEAATLSGVQDLRGQLAGMLGQPGGALMAHQFATGKPIAPIDFDDPERLRARGIEAKAAAARYGRVMAEPILSTELPALRDMVAGGGPQKLQALSIIQGFGDPQVVRAAAAQVAGAEDGAFRVASQLSLSVARDVLRGGEALKSGPQVWKEDRARADFSKWYGRTLSMVGGSYRGDVFQAAKAFYAQRAVDGGEQAYNPGRFAEAIETVMGRAPGPKGATGGIARHGKGLVIVPQGMKPDGLLQRFARASAADYHAASDGRKPRWSDGTGMTRGDFAGLLPTAIDGAGHYGFRGPGGRLIEDERGDPYVIDINRLGR